MFYLALGLYLAFVTLLCYPERGRPGARSASVPATVAMCCAVLSTCALPWSGVSFLTALGPPSWLWFPLFFVALSSTTRRGTLLSNAFLLSMLAAAATALDRFGMQTGVPGTRFSLEGLAMISRVLGVSNPRTAAALCLLFAGLFLSAALAIHARDIPAKAISFSLAGFLATVFFPWNTTTLFGIAPPTSIYLDAAFLFGCALLLGYACRKAGERLRRTQAERKGHFLTAAACVLSGCWFLYSSMR
jgi:hypothetical protein